MAESNMPDKEMAPFASDTDSVQDPEARKIYLELFDVVRDSLAGEIHKGRIEGVILRVADAFKQDPFHRLLLLFYTGSMKHYLATHITNDVILAAAFGTHLGISKDDLRDLGFCAFGHDFGMNECKEIFTKGYRPNNLESEKIQQHPVRSAEIFRPFFPKNVIEGILDIHENVDGKGYPQGKTGGDISILAKTISICDVFEALSHPRYHRPEFSLYEALKLIIKKKNVIFDRHVVKKFLEFLSIFPIGSLVSLNTDEIAMVVGSNAAAPTRPVLNVLWNAQKDAALSRRIVNLVEDPTRSVKRALDVKEEKEILDSLKPRGRVEL